MVSTRASVKKTDVVSQTDSEGSVSKIETTKTQELYVESDDDSDDEAPEAISTSTAKSSALQTAQAKREAQAKLAAEEKEKRRLRDQRLKDQRQTSKKAAKAKKETEETVEEEQNEEVADADNNDTADSGAPKSGELPKLLPQDFLQQYAKEEKAEKKRMHLSAKDFERMAEEEELKEQKQNNKKRHLSQGRQVGEYTVKVLSKRPKPQPTDQSLVDFRNQHFARADIPRRDAVLNASQGRKGGATTFARSGAVVNKRK